MKNLLISAAITILCFMLGAIGSLVWDSYSKERLHQVAALEQAQTTPAALKQIGEMEQSSIRALLRAGFAGFISAFVGLGISQLFIRWD